MNQNNSISEYLSPYQGKTILITGAGGFIGTALAHAFSQLSCHLILWKHIEPKSKSTNPDYSDVAVIYGDVADQDRWSYIFQSRQIDYVFHLASYEHKHGSEHAPYRDLETNTRSTLHLLEACRINRPSCKIVFASSGNLTGIPLSQEVSEKTPDNPLTLYAINKLASERYLRFYMETSDIQSVTLRLSNVYGPLPCNDYNLSNRVVLNRMISRGIQGEPLILFKNHDCIRDYVYLDDVIKAFLLAGQVDVKANPALYIIGSGERYTIEQSIRLMAKQVFLFTKTSPDISTDMSVELEPVEFRNFCADTAQFQNATGWKPQTYLIDGINKTIEFYLREKPNSI